MRYKTKANGIFLHAIAFLVPLMMVTDGHANDRARAMERVTIFHGYLLAMLNGDGGAGFESRYIYLEPKVAETFHIPTMAARVSGRAGKKASEATIRQFEQAFLGFTVANYIVNFKNFEGQSFETLGAELVRSGDAIRVQTVLKTGQKNVRLDYIMESRGFGWQVVDILLEGNISEVTRRAAEFRKILRASGLEGLTVALREKGLMMQSQF